MPRTRSAAECLVPGTARRSDPSGSSPAGIDRRRPQALRRIPPRLAPASPHAAVRALGHCGSSAGLAPTLSGWGFESLARQKRRMDDSSARAARVFARIARTPGKRSPVSYPALPSAALPWQDRSAREQAAPSLRRQRSMRPVGSTSANQSAYAAWKGGQWTGFRTCRSVSRRSTTGLSWTLG